MTPSEAVPVTPDETRECGNVWDPRLPDITCQRKVGENCKHGGKHTFYEGGKPKLQWWGGETS